MANSTITKRRALHKKGFFLDFFTDMWGWLIFFIGMIVWFVLFSLSAKDVVYRVDKAEVYLSDKTTLFTVLQSPSGNMTLADNILIAIKTNNPNPVQADLAQIMDSVYGRAQPSCWTLWYYVNDEKKALASVDCKGRKSVIFDEETLLPAAASEAPIKIRLTVTGYTQ